MVHADHIPVLLLAAVPQPTGLARLGASALDLAAFWALDIPPDIVPDHVGQGRLGAVQADAGPHFLNPTERKKKNTILSNALSLTKVAESIINVYPRFNKNPTS